MIISENHEEANRCLKDITALAKLDQQIDDALNTLSMLHDQRVATRRKLRQLQNRREWLQQSLQPAK